MQDDFLDLDIKQGDSYIVRDAVEPVADVADDHIEASPQPFDRAVADAPKQDGSRRSDVRMFLYGFAVMILLGLVWIFVKPALDSAEAGDLPYWDKIKRVASDIAEIPERNWFKDRTLYFTADSDGVRLATDEEVSAHKQWNEDTQNAIQDDEEEMRMYDDE